MPININTLVNQEKKEFNAYYKKLLKSILLNDELSKAMIYGSMNGGKRIRPFIVSIFAKIAKIKKNNYLRLSTAIESIHSYSLIHDDLPCMDNDEIRRGKLSTHKKFGESTAVLAGNSLLILAFKILSDKNFEWNIFINNKAKTEDPLYNRSIFISSVADTKQLLKLLPDNTQSIGLFVRKEEKNKRLLKVVKKG